MIPATEKHSSSIETGITGWISIHINDNELPSERRTGVEALCKEMERPKAEQLFAHSQELPTPLAERFPRLAFSVIALSLLIFVLTAEFDYLRGAGYYWP